MKLLKYFFSILFLLLTINLFAQKISLNDLHTMASYKNWETTNKLLIAKGWDYYDSTESDGEGYNTISWAFGRNVYDNAKATGWIYVNNYEGLPNMIIYRFRKKEYYNAIIQQITANAYTLTDEEILDNRVVASYENKMFYLKIAYNREEEEDDENEEYYNGTNKKTFTVYEVSIYKKGGIYDPKNGIKKEYDDYGNISAIYNLREGKIEGQLKNYDSIGRVVRIAQFKFGNLDGPYIENFYFDNNEDYHSFYGNYKNDVRDGKWIGEIITPSGKNIVQEFFYTNGKKQGLNKEAKDNFVFYQYYKNDILDGITAKYINIKRAVLGGYPTIDSTNSNFILHSSLEYENDLLNGTSKYYDITGSLIAEGVYKDSLKTGIWKFYHDNITDENSLPLEYSKKLYKESNYLEGKLEGIQKRYSNLEKIEIPCKEGEEEENGCFKTICIYYNETATYSNDELNGLYELRVDDNELWTKGYYLNGFKSGKWINYERSEYCYWMNKKSFETGNYFDGKRQGKWERYADDELLESYNYNDNLIDGEHITYIFNKPSEIKHFKNGDFYALEQLDDSGNIKKSYSIKNVSNTKFDCVTVETLSNGIFTFTYSFIKSDDFKISPISFQLDFATSDSKVKKLNGFFEHKLLDGKAVCSGNYTSDTKTGDWEYYFYDQNVKVTYTYDGYGILTNEYYIDLKNNEPFSGEFIHKSENGFYEERKVKEGIRNGTTRYKDSNDKIIKKESYKDGVLKE
jgi:antitoxin component YwqK of YwqJK toxin-antitoxin module